jgi:hypothetical protein
MDTIGFFIAVILTLMVFSYILGDNFLFRLAAHIFVGVAVGYAIIVIWYQVWDQVITPAFTPPVGNPLSLVPPLVICIFLVFKALPLKGSLFNALGNLGLAFILGVGAALAIGSALFGTLLPQVLTTASISWNPFNYPVESGGDQWVTWLNNIIIVLGTVGTFSYFTFAVRAPGPLGGFREGWVRFWAGMGRLIIIFTLGALFANTVTSRMALLISRLQFLASQLQAFVDLFMG